CRLPMHPACTQFQQRVSIVDSIEPPYCSQEILCAVKMVPMETMPQSATRSYHVPQRAVKPPHCGTGGKSFESDGSSNVSDHCGPLTVLFSFARFEACCLEPGGKRRGRWLYDSSSRPPAFRPVKSTPYTSVRAPGIHL